METKRDERGRILKGSVLPSPGRPKSVAQRIADMTNDGQLMLDYLCATVQDPKTSRRDRTEAAKLLMDRRWGRPVETTVQATADASNVPGAELATEQLAELARRVRESRSGQVAGPAVPPVQDPGITQRAA